MATFDDVRDIALRLPEMIEREGDHPSWRIRNKAVIWDRPLRPNDLDYLGEQAPDGPVVAVRVANLDAKEELLATERPILFTTPHFNGYPMVLVELDQAPVDLLEELITEGWLAQAPKRLAQEWLNSDSVS